MIYITLKQEVELGRYCRFDVLDVNSSGTRAVMVKPAGRREAVVTLRGLHPNARDETVLEYLTKYGKLVTKKVVYSVFSEGPLKGLRNGDRSFKLEIKPSTNLGSYHVLDGQRVTAKYPGQQQTCARCLQSAQYCKGKGIAKKCEAEGGVRADFNNYILELWKRLGYSPNNEVVDDDTEPNQLEHSEKAGDGFTPHKPPSEPTKFTGVSVKNIPKEADPGEVVEFLVMSGLPEAKRNEVVISSTGAVTIRNLENKDCLSLISSIHWKKHFGRKLYCNGYIPLTPEKPEYPPGTEATSSISPKVPGPGTALIQSKPLGDPVTPTDSAASSLSRNTGVVPLPHTEPGVLPVEEIVAGAVDSAHALPEVSCTSPVSLPDWSTRNIEWHADTDIEEQVVRRYSLSLTNRTPPKHSLAADILGAKKISLANRSLMSSIKDLQDVVSDFNPCQSTLEDSTSSTDDLEKSETISTSRKKRKKKGFPKGDYSREDFTKKQDTKVSPK